MFLKTKYIFKYKCMHAYERGYCMCDDLEPIKQTQLLYLNIYLLHS